MISMLPFTVLHHMSVVHPFVKSLTPFSQGGQAYLHPLKFSIPFDKFPPPEAVTQRRLPSFAGLIVPTLRDVLEICRTSYSVPNLSATTP
jgi:hypothetical protein